MLLVGVFSHKIIVDEENCRDDADNPNASAASDKRKVGDILVIELVSGIECDRINT
jgi:hypothetical protein